MAILMSIRPRHCCRILNGEKSLEIRSTSPKCKKNTKTVYIYCTNAKTWMEELRVDRFGEYHLVGDFVKNHEYAELESESLNGKVVAKFRLESIYVIHDFINGLEATEPTNRHVTVYDQKELLAASCLTEEQIRDYGGEFAWHIDDLQIFDKPIELSDFKYEKKYHGCAKCPYGDQPICVDNDACLNGCTEFLPVKRAPQSWMYVAEIDSQW